MEASGLKRRFLLGARLQLKPEMRWVPYFGLTLPGPRLQSRLPTKAEKGLTITRHLFFLLVCFVGRRGLASALVGITTGHEPARFQGAG